MDFGVGDIDSLLDIAIEITQEYKIHKELYLYGMISLKGKDKAMQIGCRVRYAIDMLGHPRIAVIYSWMLLYLE